MDIRSLEVVQLEHNMKKILGSFDGECADANITNLNGLDICKDVWQNVFASDEFKRGIQNGWYLGYLGHPKDVDYANFQEACIVMTEGHIDDDGKVYGKFNLVDTPVGRIVKAFQDAGVQFGISVRGAGDIINNSVDPNSFIFRGFDLVAFPAYPDSIPKFTEIAASTDIETQSKYKRICASVEDNIDEINSVESLELLKKQFAPQSPQYASIQSRIDDINNKEDNNEEHEEDEIDLNPEKIRCMVRLYKQSVEANKQLQRQIVVANKKIKNIQAANDRKIRVLKRITAAQSTSMKLNNSNDKKRYSQQNLTYRQKICASKQTIEDKDKIIASLNAKLDETVSKVKTLETRSSNLEDKNNRLRSEIQACQKLVDEYQDAYANLYSSAVGTDLSHVSVTAWTSVKELQKIIAGTSTCNLSSVTVKPEPFEVIDDEDSDDDNLVTV